MVLSGSAGGVERKLGAGFSLSIIDCPLESFYDPHKEESQ